LLLEKQPRIVASTSKLSASEIRPSFLFEQRGCVILEQRRGRKASFAKARARDRLQMIANPPLRSSADPSRPFNADAVAKRAAPWPPKKEEEEKKVKTKAR
jgi:hypothetical protein